LEWHLSAVNRWGRPYAGWEPFERDLATEFGLLLLILASAKRQNSRRQIREAFLEHLNLADSRGRPRKAHGDLSDILHGQAIDVLWNQEMQQAWNMKVSLERQGKQPRSHLKKAGTSDDVISGVLSRRATPESSLARIYAKRSHVSVGRARNALRAYEKYTGKKFVPHV